MPAANNDNFFRDIHTVPSFATAKECDADPGCLYFLSASSARLEAINGAGDGGNACSCTFGLQRKLHPLDAQ
jgi:hypothetical protein